MVGLRRFKARLYWPSLVLIPGLTAFILYTWRTQTPLEGLAEVPENVGAVLALVNVVHALMVFVLGMRDTLISVGACFSLVQDDVERLRDARGAHAGGSRLRTRWRVARVMAIPFVGLLFHFALFAALALFSSLLMNTPYITG
jgi:hypothetical protein